jgi:hypothetical protein
MDSTVAKAVVVVAEEERLGLRGAVAVVEAKAGSRALAAPAVHAAANRLGCTWTLPGRCSSRIRT